MQRPTPSIPWLKVCCLACLIASFYLVMATRTTLWDRDEPRFSRATSEMLASGDYMVPTFNDQLRPHKPILIYWLMSIPMRWLGPTELACRFWSAIGIAATCLLTFFIAHRFFNSETGIWAMLILALTLLIHLIGTAATADGVLLPLMIAQYAIFSVMITSRPSGLTLLLMTLAFGGALLAKGPVGLIPVLGMVAFLVWHRHYLPLKQHVLHLVFALLVGMAIFLAWGIPANNATQGEFVRQGIGFHVLERSTTALESHGGNFFLFLPYYIPVIIIGFFPWILFLPAGISALWRKRKEHPLHFRFGVCWVVPTFVLMTLVATKLPHYIISIWPLLAIAAAMVVAEIRQKRQMDPDQRWLRRGLILFAPVAFGGAVMFIIAPWLIEVPGIAAPSIIAGIMILCLTVIETVFLWRGHIKRTAGMIVFGMLVFHLPFQWGILPAVEQVKITPSIVSQIKAELSADTAIATLGYEEPSLNFYLGRHIYNFDQMPELLEWMRVNDSWILIADKKKLERFEPEFGPLNLRQLASKKGFHYVKGRVMEVVAVSMVAG